MSRGGIVNLKRNARILPLHVGDSGFLTLLMAVVNLDFHLS